VAENKNPLDELIEIRKIKSMDISKIFKKSFLSKMEKFESESFGVVFYAKGSVVMIVYNTLDNDGAYFAMPQLSDKLRNEVFRYLGIQEVDEDEE